MSEFGALLSTIAYRGPGVMLLAIGVLFLAGSAAATWSAWFYAGAENFKAAPGYAVARFLAASGGLSRSLFSSLSCRSSWVSSGTTTSRPH